jgi:hypothetical protein
MIYTATEHDTYWIVISMDNDKVIQLRKSEVGYTGVLDIGELRRMLSRVLQLRTDDKLIIT